MTRSAPGRRRLAGRRSARGDRLPGRLGFRMPAEWEPHAATWIAWPHERTDWPGKLAPIPWVVAEVVRCLVPGERVRVLVPDAARERAARRVLARTGVALDQVDFIRVPTDRSWTRDYCPLFVRDRRGVVAATTWRFNGWAKYPTHRRDAAVAAVVADHLGVRRWQPVHPARGAAARPVVLEGGSVDVNGRGALLTTEECLLSPVQARNPGLTREDLEALLADYLGVTKVLWLGEGIVGDDTHGHVDDLARFVAPDAVVVCVERDRGDPNYDRLRENRRRLRRMTDQDGHPLRVHELPMPAPVVFDGQRLPASYANFYVGNAAVLVPTFDDPNDRHALALLARLFPTRRVVGIHARDLVWGLGTIHCMTQQEPAAGRTGRPAHDRGLVP
jgi:agmatine deiminase